MVEQSRGKTKIKMKDYLQMLAKMDSKMEADPTRKAVAASAA